MYAWLGFECRSTLLDFLSGYLDDTHVTLDVLAYDFSEPNIVKLLTAYGSRIRIIIDDSQDHGGPGDCETIAAAQLMQSAGQDHVKRMHFSGLQHNKVINLRLAVARLDGVLIRPGETFSFCRLVGRTTRRRGYVEGMMLEEGDTALARAGAGATRARSCTPTSRPTSSPDS